jgi:hypothetical protein
VNPPCAECGDVCACGEYAPINMPRGRPPQDDTTRDRMIRVRVTSDQETRWRAAADAAGVDLSTWIRDLADAAAERETRR